MKLNIFNKMIETKDQDGLTKSINLPILVHKSRRGYTPIPKRPTITVNRDSAKNEMYLALNLKLNHKQHGAEPMPVMVPYLVNITINENQKQKEESQEQTFSHNVTPYYFNICAANEEIADSIKESLMRTLNVNKKDVTTEYIPSKNKSIAPQYLITFKLNVIQTTEKQQEKAKLYNILSLEKLGKPIKLEKNRSRANLFYAQAIKQQMTKELSENFSMPEDITKLLINELTTVEPGSVCGIEFTKKSYSKLQLLCINFEKEIADRIKEKEEKKTKKLKTKKHNKINNILKIFAKKTEEEKVKISTLKIKKELEKISKKNIKSDSINEIKALLETYNKTQNTETTETKTTAKTTGHLDAIEEIQEIEHNKQKSKNNDTSAIKHKSDQYTTTPKAELSKIAITAVVHLDDTRNTDQTNIKTETETESLSSMLDCQDTNLDHYKQYQQCLYPKTEIQSIKQEKLTENIEMQQL